MESMLFVTWLNYFSMLVHTASVFLYVVIAYLIVRHRVAYRYSLVMICAGGMFLKLSYLMLNYEWVTGDNINTETIALEILWTLKSIGVAFYDIAVCVIAIIFIHCYGDKLGTTENRS